MRVIRRTVFTPFPSKCLAACAALLFSFAAAAEEGGPLRIAAQSNLAVAAVEGESVAFSVMAEGGAGSIEYLWYHVNAFGIREHLAAAEGPMLVIEEIGLEDEGRYICEISDGNELVNSEPFELHVIAGLPLGACRVVCFALVLLFAVAGARAAARLPEA